MTQGCYTTQSINNKEESKKEEQEFEKMMSSWIGSTKNALLLSWGSPSSVASDGKGGEILTFEEVKRAYFEGRGYITVIHKYMFYVNKDNIVYHWLYSRNGREGY